jgi:serine/threonine protein kinase
VISCAESPPCIPEYELLRIIGRGSYGEVWLARGITGVFRAVKLIWRRRFSEDAPYARECEGVSRLAALSLRVPSLLPVLRVGRNPALGYFYSVMELADDAESGREIDPDRYVPFTLGELRNRRGRLAAAEAAAIGSALASGLDRLHANGLVHRDVKSSNIVLVEAAPKLADAGLVTAAEDDRAFVGTEGFAPPEGAGTPAADVYALGKVLYELATGYDRKFFPRLPPDFADWPDRRIFLELNEVVIRACDPICPPHRRSASVLRDECSRVQSGQSIRRLRAAERRAEWGVIRSIARSIFSV